MSNESVNPQAVKIAKITLQFSVSGEITESDISKLMEQVIDTIINVRPDNECENQISDQQWQALAHKYRLNYVYVPVKPCQYAEQDVAKFRAALALSAGGVHGFCRTGTRAAHLWALANKDKLSFTDMQGALKSKGYDLDNIAAMFEGGQ
jgi:uncharacterized protein (TIGR01244 family)